MSSKDFTNPFRGLRPFEAAERHLFFGRASEIESLEEKLEANHFIGVIGTSGSGKSSLVRAGLVPELLYMGGWRVALMRPGNNPIDSLGNALNSSLTAQQDDVTFWGEGETAPADGRFTASSLRQGPLGLIDTIREFRVDEKVLIVVDQFEEVFRFEEQRSDQKKAEVRDFVQLLIEASRQRELPIFICITMRSDFLGQCPLFRGLPEALNDSQYLVPQLTRAGIRQAIIEPVHWAGAEITPRVVTRLLNELVKSQDQLPLLQHALMRTFENFQNDPERSERIDIQHYSGMQKALSDHLDSIYLALTPEQQVVAANLFKSLTMRGLNGSAVRRPCTVKEIRDICDIDEDDLFLTIDRFRAQGSSFLMPPFSESISIDSVIDVTHESLIRVWPRIQEWISDESESARTYLELVSGAEAHRDGRRGLLGQPELGLFWNWKTNTRPDLDWAKRYHPSLDLAISYLRKSQRSYRISRFFKFSLPAIFVALFAGVFYLQALDKAQQAQNQAQQEAALNALKLEQEAMSANQKLTEYKLLESLRSEQVASELVNDFGEILQGASQSERKQLMKVLVPFVGTVADPGDSFFDFLDAVMLSRQIEAHSTQGDEVRLSAMYRALKQRISKYEGTVDAYEGSDLSKYFNQAIKTIEHLYPRVPVAHIRGGNVVFGKDSVITSDQGNILIYQTDTLSSDIKSESNKPKEFSAIKAVEADSESKVGKDDIVVDLVMSEGATHLISASQQGHIVIWDMSGEELNYVKQYNFADAERSILDQAGFNDAILAEDSSITSVEIVPRRDLVSNDPLVPFWTVAANDKGRVVIWNEEGDAIAILEETKNKELIRSIAASPDGSRIVTASEDKFARVYKLPTDPKGIVNPSQRFEHEQRVYDADISGGEFESAGPVHIVTASYDKFVKVWEDETTVVATLASPTERELHKDYVIDVEFSDDGNYLATAGRDKLINIWGASGFGTTNGNTLDGRFAFFTGAPNSGGARRIRFDPDFSRNYKVAVSTFDGTTYLWDVSQLNVFDPAILKEPDFDLQVQLKLGLIDNETLKEGDYSTSDKIRIAEEMLSKRLYLRVKNEAFLKNFDNDIAEIISALFERLTETGNWNERWEINQFFANNERGLKRLRDSKLISLPEQEYALIEYSRHIKSLPNELRGPAYRLLVEAGGDKIRMARIAASLQLAVQAEISREPANKYPISLLAQQIDANTVTDSLVAQHAASAPSSDVLSMDKLKSLGAMTLQDWMKDKSTNNMVDAAKYFNRLAEDKLVKELYLPDYLHVLSQLSNIPVSEHTVSFCNFAVRANKSLGAGDMLEAMQNSMACAIVTELAGLGLMGDDMDDALRLLLQSSLKYPAKIPALLASIKAAHFATSANSTSIRYLSDKNARAASYEHDARRWSVSARLLSDNPISQTIYNAVMSREKPPVKALFATEDDIKAVRFTEDAQFALVGGVDKQLYQYELNGKFRDKLDGHSSSIYRILPLSKGEIVTSGLDNKLILWGISPESKITLKRSIPHEPRSGPPVVGGSMEKGLVIGGSPVELLDPDGGIKKKFYYQHGVMSADGNFIVAKDNLIELLDAKDKDFPSLKSEKVNGIILSLDIGKQYVATGATNGLTRIWDFDLNLVLELPKLDGQIRVVRFRDDSQSFFVGTFGSGMVYEFDIKGRQLLAFRADAESIYDIDVQSVNRDLLLTGGNDHSAKLWSIADIRDFQAKFLAGQTDEITLDDLVKQRVLVSDHLKSVPARRVLEADEIARYLIGNYSRYSADNAFDSALRMDAQSAFRLLAQKYQVSAALIAEFDSLISK